MTRILGGPISAWTTSFSRVPDQIAAPLEHAFRHGVILGLSRVAKVAGRKQSPCRDLLGCLRDRHADVLRFAYDLRIPATSNQAGRDVRPAKTQQNISGRLRSEETARHRYATRGYISTAGKHGADVLTTLRDAVTGHPWMPPIPGPAMTRHSPAGTPAGRHRPPEQRAAGQLNQAAGLAPTRATLTATC